MKVPAKLYHAAPQCVLLDINDHGLKSNWGEIYAAESQGDALSFMWFRLLDHAHVGEGGFTVQSHNEIHVWEIDTSKTNPALWEIGSDHNPNFFTATSWVYGSKSIPRTSLSECYVFTREILEQAANKVEST